MSETTKRDVARSPLLWLGLLLAVVLVGVALVLLFGQRPAATDGQTDVIDNLPTDVAPATDAAPVVDAPAGSSSAALPGEVAVEAPGSTLSVETIEVVALTQQVPATSELRTPLYAINYTGDAPAGNVRVTVPDGTDLATADLIGYRGDSWRYLPAVVEGEELVFAGDELPEVVAVVAPAAERDATVGIEVLPTGELPGALFPLADEVSLGTLTLGSEGEVLGETVLIQPGAYREFVRVTNTGIAVDSMSLLPVLSDESVQTAHIADLVERAFAGGHAGINLDYQGVPPEQSAAFSRFVVALADALHARDLALAVTLAAPDLVNGQWTSVGQDWAAIGAVADILYAQMPLSPAVYAENGPAEQIVNWATRQVDRNKLSLVVTANAVDQVATAYSEVPAERALAGFGKLELMQGSDTIESGETLEVGLTGTAGSLEWDNSALAYKYTYTLSGQEHIVWLDNEAALANRLALVNKHALRGALVRGLNNLAQGDGYAAALASIDGGTAPEATAAAIVWTVVDAANNVVASATGENQFTFATQGAETPGSYTLMADFAVGDNKAPLGSYAFNVVAPVVEEPTATPEPVAEEEQEEEGEESAATPIAVSPGEADGVVTIASNFREGPGFFFAVSNVLPLGTRVDVLARDADSEWLNVAPVGTSDSGWVHYDLVQLNTNVSLDGLPIGGGDFVIATSTPAPLGPWPTATPDRSNVTPTPTPLPQPTATPTPRGPWYTPTPTRIAVVLPTAVPTRVPPTATATRVWPTATPRPQVPPPVAAAGGFELGGQTHSFAHPALMSDIGMRWVKFQHKWSPGDSGQSVADRVANAKAAGFKVLLSMPGSATYPGSIDFAGYVNFLRSVASLNPAPDAIEVWNEMNIDFEWPAGQISPTQYVNEMLRPAYQAIKAANPNIIVVSGAPAPTGFDNNTNAWADDRYMRGVAAAGGAAYMDCVGVHYNAGATAPAQDSGHPADDGARHYSWYFWPTLNMYYNAFGGSRKLCVTELGYLTTQDFGNTPPNFRWAGGTSIDQHAQWLASAVGLSASSGKVRMLIIFNVDFTHFDPNGDPQAGYALVRPNGGCPACPAIKSVMGR